MADYWTELKRADEALRTEACKAEEDLKGAYARFRAAGGNETGCCVECAEPELTERANDVARRFHATFGWWPF